MNLVPVQIRKHLIPFFFEEFEGVEANYLNKKVKACEICTRSTIGFLILTSLQKTDFPVKTEGKHFVYISYSSDTVEAQLFQVKNGKNNFLKVPEHISDKINDILEDIFRYAFLFQTKGMLIGNPDLLVKEALTAFMIEYKLDDFGFNLESVRRLMNRGSKNKLSRLQNKISNRFLH